MSSVIVDLEGFKVNKNNEFICKQFAVVYLTGEKEIETNIFISNFSNQSTSNQSLTEQQRYSEWCHSTFLSSINRYLNKKEVENIYVKGSEKAELLKKCIEKSVTNLEDLGCSETNINSCASENVELLLKWFRKRFNTLNSLETFQNNGGILNFMLREEIAQLPIEFIMVYADKQINSQWCRFPNIFKVDARFQQYLCCPNHYHPGSTRDVTGYSYPMKKDCSICNIFDK